MSTTTQWIALNALPRFGPAKVISLINQGFSPDQLLSSSANTLSALGLPKAACTAVLSYQLGQGPLQERIDQLLQWQQQSGQHHLLCYADQNYPSLLAEITDPPLVLMVIGDVNLLSMPQVALVGSRHATRQGLQNAGLFSKALSAAGVTVTSGLAAGIDGAAHQAVVAAQLPTIAVMGTGPDQVYPARHRQLADDIVANGGALVTEYKPGTAPFAGNFPRRNRIIAGLSQGVLVIEAAERSGSLITARLALECNREVFAIPGTIHSPQSQGCHQLIRDGATLVQSAAHIIEQLGSLLAANQYLQADAEQVTQQAIAPSVELNNEEQRLLKLMEHEQLSLDQLSGLSGLSIAELSQHMVTLEIKGLVEAVGLGYQRTVMA